MKNVRKYFYLLIIFALPACFSGCIFYNEFDLDSSARYSVTFSNESDYYVYDWYLKNYDTGNNYVKYKDDFYPVPENKKKTIRNIPCGWYKVYFSFEKNPGYYDYWTSRSRVYLNRDKIYRLTDSYSDSVSDRFENRQIGKNENPCELYLEDEDGNKIEFVKAGAAH